MAGHRLPGVARGVVEGASSVEIYFYPPFSRITEYAAADRAVIEILYRPELAAGMHPRTAVGARSGSPRTPAFGASGSAGGGDGR